MYKGITRLGFLGERWYLVAVFYYLCTIAFEVERKRTPDGFPLHIYNIDLLLRNYLFSSISSHALPHVSSLLHITVTRIYDRPDASHRVLFGKEGPARNPGLPYPYEEW